jgi:FKBP-type peptidyl-prolyl cis-trans isomerase
VKCQYEGRLIDGTVFDSSYKRNEPFEVNLAQPLVIKGWVEVLKLMPAGSKWEVYIPQEQGYGSQDMGDIKPYSTLIFTIETLK